MFIWQWLETGRDARDDFIVQAPKVESLMGISESISMRPMSKAQMKRPRRLTYHAGRLTPCPKLYSSLKDTEYPLRTTKQDGQIFRGRYSQ